MRKTVGTTAVQLDNPTVNYAETIAIRDASANIYIGGPDVSSSSASPTYGFPIKTADAPLIFKVPADGLWAIVASSTATVEVLQF